MPFFQVGENGLQIKLTFYLKISMMSLVFIRLWRSHLCKYSINISQTRLLTEQQMCHRKRRSKGEPLPSFHLQWFTEEFTGTIGQQSFHDKSRNWLRLECKDTGRCHGAEVPRLALGTCIHSSCLLFLSCIHVPFGCPFIYSLPLHPLPGRPCPHGRVQSGCLSF